MADAPEADVALPTGTVTFLLTDIEGSTRLFHRLGAEYEALQDAHRQIIRRAFAKRDGAEVACPGDGFLIAFGDAEDAVASAVAAQRELTSFPWPDGGEVRVRMGLHSGAVRVTSTGGTYVGMALHEAARVAGVAHGGQVLVSETTRALLATPPEDVSLTDLGEHELKDLSRPLRLYEVRGEGLLSGFAPVRAARTRVGNVHAGEPIIGREREVATVAALVRPGSLVTLLGPGGVGKTTLATAVAYRATDDDVPAWLVELASVPVGAGTDAVASAVGATIGTQVGGDIDALVAALRDRRAFVVLDNCEHVIAAASKVAAALVDGCPGVSLLATSREPLGCRGERVQVLDPLPADDAAALFIARAIETGATNVESDADGILRVCHRLDGLPLAVELAAKRARTLSPSAIADRLDDRFRLLKGGHRDSLPRQQTLEAAVDWSHDLLDEPSRVLFRRLSVFTGGWTLEAAEQVCGFDPLDSFDVLDTLGGLVDRSLVTVDTTTERYAMLETIKAYAADRLGDAGELDALRDRHLEWMSSVGWDLLWAFALGTPLTGLPTIHAEGDNLRAAIAHALAGGDAEAGLRLASGAAIFGMQARGGYYYEAHRWIDELVKRVDDPELLCVAYCSAANSSTSFGDMAKAQRVIEQAHALVERHELSDGMRAQVMAMSHRRLGHRRADADNYVEAARLATGAGHLGFATFCHTFACTAYLEAGDTDSARVHAEEALVLGRRSGHGPGIARALIWLGNVFRAEGDLQQAEACWIEAGAVASAASAIAEVGVSHGRRSELRAAALDIPGTIEHLDAAIECFESVGQWQGAANAGLGRAAVALVQGDEAAAVRCRNRAIDALSRCAPESVDGIWQSVIRLTKSVGFETLIDELRALPDAD